MQKKIKFSVISSSSHEDHFSAKELLVHAPTVRGWRSSRSSSFPQHVTIQLEQRSRIRKLQLLAHQYLIPTKVEFHVGDIPPDGGSSELQLRRLGYVSMSDNERTGFRARELKSVHVDAVGTFLKISLYRNHVNPLNRYSQVSLVAFNVLGEALDGASCWRSTEPSERPPLQLEAALERPLRSTCEPVSPLDDLAFDMYQDPEVAHIIRVLDQKKQDMVHQENFEQAKALKQAMADLQQVGERLARYDVEKRCAIEKEDYDLAKKKKELMQELRRNIYQQLEEHGLLDMSTVAVATLASHPPLRSLAHHGAPEPHVSADAFRKEAGDDEEREPSEERHRPAEAPPTTAGPRRTDVLGEERPLPSLQTKDRAAERFQSPGPPAERTPASSGVSRQLLSERAQREAGPAADVYGESLVAEAFSRTWCQREQALLAVHNKLLEASSSSSPKEELRNMIRAAGLLTRRALLDKVTLVFYASLKLLRLILIHIIPDAGLGRAEAALCLQQTFPHLLQRTGDAAGRPRAAAVAFIQEIAALKYVRSLQMIPAELMKPFKSSLAPRLARSRLELLEKLLAELGTESFPLEAVIRFCRAALEHSTKEVRELALRVILSLYRQHRGDVLDLLPPRDAAAPKRFLYKRLFDGFSQIDGKLTEIQDLEKGGILPDDEEEQLAGLEEEMTGRRIEGPRKQRHPGGQQQVTKEPQKACKATSGLTEGGRKRGGVNTQQPVRHLDSLCIFCGEEDESFTEDGLDLHYWEHCPMLHRCHECGQVVEVSGLSRHLLDECESRSRFRACPRCSQALPAEALTPHLQGSCCHSSRGGNRCPLCHSSFLPGEEAWKAHLMGKEGCKQNARRTAVSWKTQPAQGKADKPKPWCSAGVRVVPVDRGRRPPFLVPVNTKVTQGKH